MKSVGILPEVDPARRQGGRTRRTRLSVPARTPGGLSRRGVWAHDADTKGILEVGDIDEALTAASGDRRRHAPARKPGLRPPPTAPPTAPRRSGASGSSGAIEQGRLTTPATRCGGELRLPAAAAKGLNGETDRPSRGGKRDCGTFLLVLHW